VVWWWRGGDMWGCSTACWTVCWNQKMRLPGMNVCITDETCLCRKRDLPKEGAEGRRSCQIEGTQGRKPKDRSVFLWCRRAAWCVVSAGLQRTKSPWQHCAAWAVSMHGYWIEQTLQKTFSRHLPQFQGKQPEVSTWVWLVKIMH